MQEADFSDDIHVPSTSRLMSESPMLPARTSTSYDDPDLSISELSISDRTAMQNKPFSLLAQPFTQAQEGEDENGVLAGEGEEKEQGATSEGDEVDEEERQATVKKLVTRQREEKLQRDIAVLKKLNSAFTAFNNALDDVGSANTVKYYRYRCYVRGIEDYLYSVSLSSCGIRRCS